MSQPNIFYKFQSKNFDGRKKKIEFIILHYTETSDLETAIALLTSNERKVSCHYLIDTNGDIYNLVKEEKRAWHAGVSEWKSLKDINSRSIGIEVVNAGEAKSDFYPDIQIDALIKLIQNIKKKFSIPNQNILGHSDIAPLRKIDPGKYFPWKKLFNKKIGIWADCISNDTNLTGDQYKLLLKNLSEIGYPEIELGRATDNNDKVIDAYHRHFLPRLISKRPTLASLELTKYLLKTKIT